MSTQEQGPAPIGGTGKSEVCVKFAVDHRTKYDCAPYLDAREALTWQVLGRVMDRLHERQQCIRESPKDRTAMRSGRAGRGDR